MNTEIKESKWSFIKTPNQLGLEEYEAIVDEEGRIICSLLYGAKLNKPPKSAEEIKANAYLICNAPSLRDELIDLIALINKGATMEEIIKKAKYSTNVIKSALNIN